jgi:hypothetical protein
LFGIAIDVEHDCSSAGSLITANGIGATAIVMSNRESGPGLATQSGIANRGQGTRIEPDVTIVMDRDNRYGNNGGYNNSSQMALNQGYQAGS